MTLLPAVVPPIPAARGEVVPAKLAAKVAPLFGVPWADSPFGGATWVSDFRRITLSEIARGAPLPTRSQAATLLAGARERTHSGGGDRAVGDRGDGWALVERVGIAVGSGSLPNEIPNATLNRFGPDTKAAVVLTAVNGLLDPLRAAIEETVPLLRDETGAPLPPSLRLAGWAHLLVEIFRSQPALVSAGILARAIQRPLTDGWDVPVAPSAEGLPLTRCEVSVSHAAVAPTQPRDLDVADATFGALRLRSGRPATAAGAAADQVADMAQAEVRETVVGTLLYRLLDVGTLRDASHLWLAQRRPGQLAMEALLTPASIVDRFVRMALPLAGVDNDRSLDEGGPLPVIPTAAELDRLPPLARRAAAIALLGVLRQVLAHSPAKERVRDGVHDRAARLRDLVEGALPADDPVRAVVACRADLIAVGLTRRDADNRGLAGLLAQLDESTRRCQDLFDAGILDRGATAEILSASNMEVNALRNSNALRRSGGLPSPEELDERLRERWRHWLAVVEATPEMLAGERQPVGLLGYHLHNYAAFLASHANEEDQAAAVQLFRDIVLPARERFFAGSGIFDPLGVSLQMASAATTGLTTATLARRGPGDLRRARKWAALGHQMITRALDDPGVQAMVAATTEDSCRFVLRAVPALVLAIELDVTDDVRRELDRAAGLLEVGRRWEHAAFGSSGRYARHAEIEEWSRRLDILHTAHPASPGNPTTPASPPPLGPTAVTAAQGPPRRPYP